MQWALYVLDGAGAQGVKGCQASSLSFLQFLCLHIPAVVIDCMKTSCCLASPTDPCDPLKRYYSSYRQQWSAHNCFFQNVLIALAMVCCLSRIHNPRVKQGRGGCLSMACRHSVAWVKQDLWETRAIQPTQPQFFCNFGARVFLL